MDLASNDYLGFSRDPRVVAAARAALEEFGTGSRARAPVWSRARWGIHEWLETGAARARRPARGAGVLAVHRRHRRARWRRRGHAHHSTPTRTHGWLTGPGCARSPVRIARHSDVARVAELLASAVDARDRGGGDRSTRCGVVVPPQPGARGDVQAADALLLVDEARRHRRGRREGGGSCADWACGIPARGADAHAVQGAGRAGRGGAGSPALREHLVNTAGPFIFDTALAPTSAAATTEAARIIGEARAGGPVARAARFVGVHAEHPHARAAVQSVHGHSGVCGCGPRSGWRPGCRGGLFPSASVPDGVRRLRITAPGDVELQECSGALDHVREVLVDASGVTRSPREAVPGYESTRSFQRWPRGARPRRGTQGVGGPRDGPSPPHQQRAGRHHENPLTVSLSLPAHRGGDGNGHRRGQDLRHGCSPRWPAVRGAPPDRRLQASANRHAR
ncbi:8-amino-7-oxononanoate synthase [Kocuria rhizophila]|nr:8-amino-7-oxononanoate synthase [Kocuria rhizophila]